MEIIYSFLVLFIISLVVGIILSLASILFHVEEDILVEDIHKLLPGYNCGACGYPGCLSFAQNIVNCKVNKLSLCKPGKKDIHFIPIINKLNEKDIKVDL